MTSSFVITVKSGRSQADSKRFIKDTTEPREEAKQLARLFERLASGIEPGSSFDVTTSANAPVRATATVTITNASVTANDTLTVAGTVLTAKASGATGPQFNIGANATATAVNVVAAINANQQVVTATSAAGVVTVTSNTSGAVGNFVTLATSHTAAFTLSAATLAGGAGGSETAALSYSRGL